MTTGVTTSGLAVASIFLGIVLGQVAPGSNQLGLWITSLISVCGSVTAVVIAYRTLIKDFVTKTELQVEVAKVILQVEAGLKESRHDTANKINDAKLQLEAKMETQTQALMENARILGRIEGIIGARKQEGLI